MEMTDILNSALPYIPYLMSVGLAGLLALAVREINSIRVDVTALSDTLEQINEELAAEKEKLQLQEQVVATAEQLREEDARLRAELEEKARLAIQAKNEQFSVISDAVNERNSWQRMYRQSSISNQTAQDWLMREVERLLVVANAYATKLGRKKVKVDAHLKDLVAEFAEEHGEGAHTEPAEDPPPTPRDSPPGAPRP